jgi:hypothetical protein
VDGYQITIYGIYNLRIKAKDNHNITRNIKPAFYITDMIYYNVILGLIWLDYVNSDIHWLERKWFYYDFITSVKEFFKKDFEKSLKKKIIIYAFYGSLINLE